MFLLYKYVHKECIREIHTYKDLYMNVYNHLIYHSLKLERAQMLKNKTVTKNKKEQTNDKCNNMDESQNYEARHQSLPNV